MCTLQLTRWLYERWKFGPDRSIINRLTPNDLYMVRTAPLTSKRCILYIYSTNIGTEYFKHALYSPFFFSSKCSLFHNCNLFGSCIIHFLYTDCAKIKKNNNSGAKALRSSSSFLRLLPRLPVTSIPPFISPSISRCRRLFLGKM